MNNLNMFWRSVESIGWGARDAALRENLGDTYNQILPYLAPSQTLSYQIACERTPFDHACRYRIVEEPNPVGTYTAVCDEGRCPAKVFARHELVRYTINPQTMGHAVARCLGLHPQVTQIHKHVWQVGSIAGSTELIPVFFNRLKSESSMRQALEHLLLKGRKGFVWVTPSARYIDAQVQQLLSRNESAPFTLDEFTEFEGQDIVLNEQGVVRWKKVRESLGGGTVLGAIFPTPQGAGWHDLTLVFRDGHTLVATIGQTKRIYTYQDMGMIDRRKLTPDAQWALLFNFAEEMGIFTWSSRNADHRNKKRKERLAAKLKNFFGIQGEPFTYRKDDGGWEAVFNIRTEH